LGVDQDSTKAFGWYLKAAQQGNATGEFNVGQRYAEGDGTLQSYTLAVYWYRKAAEQNYPAAMWNLGSMYHTGQGMPQDFAKAYFWFDLALSRRWDNMDLKYRSTLITERDEVASYLTNTILIQTQEQARKWAAQHP
jgi:uncharacterized protein